MHRNIRKRRDLFLKRCVLCGGRGRYQYRRPKHMIRCEQCGVTTGYWCDWTGKKDRKARKECIKAWNDGRVQVW